MVHTHRSQAPDSPLPPFPLWGPCVCSLHLCLYFCFASKTIYTSFLDTTQCALTQDICVSLWTCFTLCDSPCLYKLSFVPFRGWVTGAFLEAQMVKNPPAMWETWIQLLGWEDPLEEGMATHSSVPAWRIPWTEEPGGLQSTGSQSVRQDWGTKCTAQQSVLYIYHIFLIHSSADGHLGHFL